ncbi:MAG TPA: hypothetical protein VM942_09850 [Acidimicrobiales bacterium]|nr:hypothetical protein [Acidimicrobiales bacterium]
MPESERKPQSAPDEGAAPREADPDYVVPDGPAAGRPRWRFGLLVSVVVVVVAVAATLAVIRLSDRPDQAGSDNVRTGANSEASPPATPVPAAPQVELQLAAGWDVLHADGDHLVVGTHPLGGRDLFLARLARADAVFSDFPPDGVVLVVGMDRFVAKITGGQPVATVPGANGLDGIDLSELSTDPPPGPGPPLGLGPPTSLVGGGTVRLGDVPRTGVLIAAYFGPAAPESAALDAEAMAATVRLLPQDPASVPPPPPGSRPGFDAGGVDLTGGTPVDVVAVEAVGMTYTAQAVDDCAIVSSPDGRPVAGGGECRPRPTGSAAEVVAVAMEQGLPPIAPPPPFPGAPESRPGVVAGRSQALLVLARVGPDARQVTAVLIDGREVDLTIGRDGWALMVSDARPFVLEVHDARRKVVALVPIS